MNCGIYMFRKQIIYLCGFEGGDKLVDCALPGHAIGGLLCTLAVLRILRSGDDDLLTQRRALLNAAVFFGG